MTFSGFLATISIIFSSFVGNGSIAANDDISLDYYSFSKYSYSELYSVMVDDFNRLFFDSSLGFGYYIENEDTDQSFYFLPLEIFSLYLPFYEDIYYYALYYTLDSYSINENYEIYFNWTYDIESYCYDDTLGEEFLKSIQTRNYSSYINFSDYSSYNIKDLSLFVEVLVNELPSSFSFSIYFYDYFRILNNLYNTGYDEGLSESFQSGYDSGYNEGYDEGFDWGQELGYNQGFSEGSSSSLANPFDIIRSALKGPLDFLMLEIAPNITIGTILLIPLSITILVFLLKGLVK